MTRVSRGVRRDIPAGAASCSLLDLGMFSTLQDPAVHTLPPCSQSPIALCNVSLVSHSSGVCSNFMVQKGKLII